MYVELRMLMIEFVNVLWKNVKVKYFFSRFSFFIGSSDKCHDTYGNNGLHISNPVINS